MDFTLMKRKDLQELCKKQGIPANSTSSSMIESLESLFQIPKVVKRKGCLKCPGAAQPQREGLGIGGPKKVRFLLEEEEAVADEVEDLGFGGKRGRKTSRRVGVQPQDNVIGPRQRSKPRWFGDYSC